MSEQIEPAGDPPKAKKPADMTPEERHELVESMLAEQRSKAEYQRLRESVKQVTRVTDTALRFKVR